MSDDIKNKKLNTHQKPLLNLVKVDLKTLESSLLTKKDIDKDAKITPAFMLRDKKTGAISYGIPGKKGEEPTIFNDVDSLLKATEATGKTLEDHEKDEDYWFDTKNQQYSKQRLVAVTLDDFIEQENLIQKLMKEKLELKKGITQ